MKSAWISIVGALVPAIIATALAHRYVERSVFPRDFAGGFGGTIIVNSLLGLPSAGQMEPAPAALNGNPRYRRFVDGVVMVVRPHIDPPPEWCEVSVTGPQDFGRGWPFLSNAPLAEVLIIFTPSESHPLGQILIWVDERGEDPFRPLGLIGNGVFYFVLFLAVIYAGRSGFFELERRLNRQRHAFPVISLEDELKDS